MKTDVFDDRDHVEWHDGVEKYGFWCFSVSDSKWLDNIKDLQSVLSPVLQRDYLRFPHVTVATLGLMTEANWCLFEQQLEALNILSMSPVVLDWQAFSSYIHVPIIRLAYQGLVQQGRGLQEHQIIQIRKQLHSISTGDDQSDYDPHITLGYYSQCLEIDTVLQRVAQHSSNTDIECPKSHHFNELLFCTYQTSNIKGAIEIYHRVPLDPIV